MEISLVVLVILIVIVIFFFKSFGSFVYFIMISDIFFRLMYKIAELLNIAELTSFLHNNIPGSIPALIGSCSSGILNTLLMLGYLVIVIIFEFDTIRIFFKKR